MVSNTNEFDQNVLAAVRSDRNFCKKYENLDQEEQKILIDILKRQGYVSQNSLLSSRQQLTNLSEVFERALTALAPSKTYKA